MQSDASLRVDVKQLLDEFAERAGPQVSPSRVLFCIGHDLIRTTLPVYSISEFSVMSSMMSADQPVVMICSCCGGGQGAAAGLAGRQLAGRRCDCVLGADGGCTGRGDPRPAEGEGPSDMKDIF